MLRFSHLFFGFVGMFSKIVPGLYILNKQQRCSHCDVSLGIADENTLGLPVLLLAVAGSGIIPAGQPRGVKVYFCAGAHHRAILFVCKAILQRLELRLVDFLKHGHEIIRLDKSFFWKTSFHVLKHAWWFGSSRCHYITPVEIVPDHLLTGCIVLLSCIPRKGLLEVECNSAIISH